MIKLLFHRLLPPILCLIFFWVFTLFFALPIFNSPAFAQIDSAYCDSIGKEYCLNFTTGYPECVDPGKCGGSGGTSGVGTIRPPAGFGIPTTSDPQTFIAGLVRNGITLMIIVAFVIDLIWTILAGYRFILAQGDPKTISAAWSQIYWGLIGLAVIMGSFAIIRMAETFFKVDIITSGLRLPTGLTP